MSSSMNMRRAFQAGYLPQAAGLYFNGVELLAQVARAAGQGRLAIQVGEERERVVGQRDEALRRVDETAAHVARLGGRPVERPEDAGAFGAWSEAVFAAVQDAVEPGSPEAVAHLLGWVLGEAVATLDVIGILSRLRELDPDNLFLRLQGDSLERDRTAVERRLGKLAAHPVLPEAVQVAAALAAHAVADAGPSGSYAARATRAGAARQAVSGQAEVAEAAL
jgi:hypothetical protein